MNEITADNLINKVKLLLKAKKETRKELCSEIGLRYTSFDDWKIRGTIPAADTVWKIAQHFGVSMEYLLCNESSIPDDIAVACSYLKELPQDKRKEAIELIKVIYDHNTGN